MALSVRREQRGVEGTRHNARATFDCDRSPGCAPGYCAFARDAEAQCIPGTGTIIPAGMCASEDYEVYGDEALEALRAALYGRYHIVVLSEDEWSSMLTSVPAARQAIARAR